MASHEDYWISESPHADVEVLAFVMSYDSCLDYSSVCGPTELKFPPYGSGGNSIKGSAPHSKSDSDFYNGPPREGLGVYRPMRRWVIVALSRLMVANSEYTADY